MNQKERQARSQRKQYFQPQLVEYGQLSEVTKGGSGSDPEGKPGTESPSPIKYLPR